MLYLTQITMKKTNPKKHASILKLEKLYKSKEFKDFEATENFELNLAVTLKKIREEKGLTQKQLALRMGVEQPAIARMERGTKITMDTMKRFCGATDTQLTLAF